MTDSDNFDANYDNCISTIVIIRLWKKMNEVNPIHQLVSLEIGHQGTNSRVPLVKLIFYILQTIIC